MLPRSEFPDGFQSYELAFERNPFQDLLASVRFEELGKGRQGAVLVQPDENGSVPIVRTTSQYRTPAQVFASLHRDLARQIQHVASIPGGFNNALVEVYTNAYTTMGSHSDQALDLEEDSFIALFSCYQHPDRANPHRKLLIESKKPEAEKAEIPLPHHRVLVFSVDANRRFRHKIVLNASRHTPENQWLGITFRTSRTRIRFRDQRACFPDGTELTLASEEQRREFYQLRRRENEETDFAYPPIPYTISESDRMPPEILAAVQSP